MNCHIPITSLLTKDREWSIYALVEDKSVAVDYSGNLQNYINYNVNYMEPQRKGATINSS